MIEPTPIATEGAAVFARNIFKGRSKWLAMRANYFVVEDEEGRHLCHARVVDTTCRSAFLITQAYGTQGLLSILRPQGNFRMETMHEGVPVTDNIYRVTDLTSNQEIGILQKPWLKGLARDLWIVRDVGWNEICRITQSSLLRAWLRTLVSSLPGRYSVLGQAGSIGTIRRSWYVARAKVSIDLREDYKRTLDRRLAVALLMLLLSH